MRAVRDIAYNMKFGDYCVAICNHYCNNKPKKGNFYDWYSYLGNEFIKRMCENVLCVRGGVIIISQGKHIKYGILNSPDGNIYNRMLGGGVYWYFGYWFT